MKIHYSFGALVYAVIRTGSKQYRVEQGMEILVERLSDAEPGKAFELKDVLLYSEGTSLSVGRPAAPAAVHCLCVGHEMGPKLHTIKYKRHKNYKRRYGHRQQYTRLLVEKIERKDRGS